MFLKKRFNEIKHFLSPFEKLWSLEVVNFYPESLTAYKTEWINQLQDLTLEQLWQLDCHFNPDALEDGELKNIITAMRSLESIPPFENDQKVDLPTWASYNVKRKKMHEIKQLIPLVEQVKEKKSITNAVDIGGGVGHLARILAHYEGLETLSIDFNKYFQELGEKRAAKYPKPKQAKGLTFFHHEFGDASLEDKTLIKAFDSQTLSLGLHTCGPLALLHMKMFTHHKNPAMINFGCCYAKLAPETEVNLSQEAQLSPLKLTSYALSLATRGHAQISYEDFLFKKQVKRQRYLLHFLMIEKLGFKEFESVGKGRDEDYMGPFRDYARKKMQDLGREIELSDEQLDSFEAEYSELVEKLFLATVIRWQFGRCIELYILLDRCLHLRDQGVEDVRLLPVFDNELSPRNMAIVALKSSSSHESK